MSRVNSGKKWLAASAVTASAFGAVVLWLFFWAAGSDATLDRADKLSSMAGPPLAIAAFVATVVVGVLGLRATKARPPGDMVADLARLVGRQWEREATARGLTRQDPLEVRWTSTERPVSPRAADVTGARIAGRPLKLRLRGGVADLAHTLLELPAHQLVVLGGPGSGKTSAAILLTLHLLESREPGAAVPVLLSLASWKPDKKDLRTWMAEAISADHPAFSEGGVHGPQAVHELIDRGLVLPVLDALDEVPCKVEAFKGIAATLGRTRSLVVTCRADEYEEIIRVTGVPLGKAAVVELRPVAAKEAARYLEAGTTDGDRRWHDVVAALREDTDGVLARALSAPLVVYLAKTVYTSQARDPKDLLALEDSAAVEDHLLEAYLPALYPDPRNPRRWLAFLAHRLSENPYALNLAWWRLVLLLPDDQSRTWPVRVGIVAIVISAAVPPADVTQFALIVAAALWGVYRRSNRGPVPPPRYLTIRWPFAAHQVWTAAFVGPLALSLVLALSMGWPDMVPPVMVNLMLLLMVLVVVLTGVYGLSRPLAADAPVGPRESLSKDRTMSLLLASGPALFLATVNWWSGTPPFLFALLMAVIGGVVMSGAWVNFIVARLFFAGRLPWRLMRFLEDAHRRGVLRQVGATYEFRHQRLQQYFAHQQTGRKASTAGAGPGAASADVSGSSSTG